MQKKTYRLLAALAAVLLSAAASAQNSYQFRGVQPDAAKWVDTYFAKGVVPPFSFLYDGVPSATFLKKWDFTAEDGTPSQEGEFVRIFTWSDPATHLVVTAEVKGYPGYNAVEWVLRFANGGRRNSGQISDVKVSDISFRSASRGSFELQYADGTHVSKADFHPRRKELKMGENVYMSPPGGRSSDQVFPFFNLIAPSGRDGAQGVMSAVGWTGTWYADIAAGRNGTSIISGLKNLDTYLEPGETIRTSSFCLLFYQGEDYLAGHNKWRRFMINIQAPKVCGKPAVYPVSCSFNYGDPYPCNEYTCMTESYAIAMMKRFADFGLVPETFWMDAGWYAHAKEYWNNKNWANTVGNWMIDEERFPHGLKPVSDTAHALGAKFMLWFEPERVIKDSYWGRTLKGWMLDAPGTDAYLFDLGNPEALDYFCSYIGDFMQRNGIDYYRQDFNMNVDNFWRANDRPGRTGICEIRHITGLYAFWDYLLKRFPNAIIDNCASGGRRIDFETMKRSAPMWRTDYNYGEPLGYQTHTYGLNYFLPLTGTGVDKTDRFSFRSSLGTSVIFNWKVTEPEFDMFEFQRCYKEFFDVRPYFYEDYYPLTTYEDMTADDIWLAYQLYRPTDGTGYVVAFRRDLAEEPSLEVRFGGVEKDASYEITDCDTGMVETLTGAQLRDGYTLHIAERRGSQLLRYRKIK